MNQTIFRGGVLKLVRKNGKRWDVVRIRYPEKGDPQTIKIAFTHHVSFHALPKNFKKHTVQYGKETQRKGLDDVIFEQQADGSVTVTFQGPWLLSSYYQ